MSPRRISTKTLRSWLTATDPPVIVDVRDEDRIGGHIRGSINVPSRQFAQELDQLHQQIADRSRVVFHCQLSQQRGPLCARAYAEKAVPGQEVYILDGGFSGWASLYGQDPNVTEAFIADLYS